MIVRKASRADMAAVAELSRELTAHVNDTDPGPDVAVLLDCGFGPDRWFACLIAEDARRGVLVKVWYIRAVLEACLTRRMALKFQYARLPLHRCVRNGGCKPCVTIGVDCFSVHLRRMHSPLRACCMPSTNHPLLEDPSRSTISITITVFLRQSRRYQMWPTSKAWRSVPLPASSTSPTGPVQASG